LDPATGELAGATGELETDELNGPENGELTVIPSGEPSEPRGPSTSTDKPDDEPNGELAVSSLPLDKLDDANGEPIGDDVGEDLPLDKLDDPKGEPSGDDAGECLPLDKLDDPSGDDAGEGGKEKDSPIRLPLPLPTPLPLYASFICASPSVSAVSFISLFRGRP
jgi:hypothetical protein